MRTVLEKNSDFSERKNSFASHAEKIYSDRSLQSVTGAVGGPASTDTVSTFWFVNKERENLLTPNVKFGTSDIRLTEVEISPLAATATLLPSQSTLINAVKSQVSSVMESAAATAVKQILVQVRDSENANKQLMYEPIQSKVQERGTNVKENIDKDKTSQVSLSSMNKHNLIKSTKKRSKGIFKKKQSFVDKQKNFASKRDSMDENSSEKTFEETARKQDENRRIKEEQTTTKKNKRRQSTHSRMKNDSEIPSHVFNQHVPDNSSETNSAKTKSSTFCDGRISVSLNKTFINNQRTINKNAARKKHDKKQSLKRSSVLKNRKSPKRQSSMQAVTNNVLTKTDIELPRHNEPRIKANVGEYLENVKKQKFRLHKQNTKRKSQNDKDIVMSINLENDIQQVTAEIQSQNDKQNSKNIANLKSIKSNDDERLSRKNTKKKREKLFVKTLKSPSTDAYGHIKPKNSSITPKNENTDSHPKLKEQIPLFEENRSSNLTLHESALSESGATNQALPANLNKLLFHSNDEKPFDNNGHVVRVVVEEMLEEIASAKLDELMSITEQSAGENSISEDDTYNKALSSRKQKKQKEFILSDEEALMNGKNEKPDEKSKMTLKRKRSKGLFSQTFDETFGALDLEKIVLISNLEASSLDQAGNFNTKKD